jgi:hypothetical protein
MLSEFRDPGEPHEADKDPEENAALGAAGLDPGRQPSSGPPDPLAGSGAYAWAMRRFVAALACLVVLSSCRSASSPSGRSVPSPTPSPSVGREVSLEEAADAVSYRLPRVAASPLTGRVEGVFLREGDVEGRRDEGPAVVFQWPGDLTLTVDPTLKGYDPRNYPMSHGVIVVPEVKGDPTEEPRWALREVRGHTAVGLDPTDDHYGMLSFAENGVFLTFQSPVHSLEELIEMAESIGY